MCGRFILKGSWADTYQYYDLLNPVDIGRNVPPRYNIAPTQDVLFVHQVEGENQLNEGRWWLVPHWAKEIPKYTLFNARSEDAHKKPSFRDAYKWGRCLIPADGYYEWSKAEDGGKDPRCLTLPNWEHFAFAGLWATNTQLEITSCTILTAPAAEKIKHLHHRMPVILNPEEHGKWLNLATPVEEARNLLVNNRGSELVSYRIGRDVNSSTAKGEDLISPIVTEN